MVRPTKSGEHEDSAMSVGIGADRSVGMDYREPREDLALEVAHAHPAKTASEPPWIKHDGSAVCPVPGGHDVEVLFRDGDTSRDNDPAGWRLAWRNITHYRDWTAFEAKTASVGEVPEWAKSRAQSLLQIEDPRPIGESNGQVANWIVLAFARYIAAHEPAPVDPLREPVMDAFEAASEEIGPNTALYGSITNPEKLLAELRQRGVTAGERG